MNNRFKFRVWDNINKRYENDLSLIDKDGDLCYQDGHKYCNGEHPEDFTIEQCTGLTDKNGKMLYEGDIVSFDGVKMFVEWSEKCCRWVLRYADKKHSLYWETMSMCPPAEDYYPNEYRVTGNIHEMEVEK